MNWRIAQESGVLTARAAERILSAANGLNPDSKNSIKP
jgi:hypothetical protein